MEFGWFPAIMKRDAVWKSLDSLIHFAGLPFGNKKGQKMADGHTGMTSVPVPLQASRWLTHLAIWQGGGTSQLFSDDQE